MRRWTYTLLLYCLLPLAPLKLVWRGIKQPDYLHYWHERFGFYRKKPGFNREKPGQPLIWLHCVSVGETRAAAPLVQELRRRHPDHHILLTHTTPTGRATGCQLFGDSITQAYLPYDVPGAVARFLRHFQPRVGLLLETELWFNLIAACKRRQIPLLLVNARLSEKSARGYGKVARLTAEGLQSLAAIAAQTAQDKARLQALGAREVQVSGNLKFDVEPPDNAREQGMELRRRFMEVAGADRPVFLAASTREGEEAQILDAIYAAAVPRLLTVIVPRHPERFTEVAHLLKQRNIPFALRSRLEQAEPGKVDVIVGDSMGEMFAYYAACDVAFIGGSLQPYGGQNLIEACVMAKPVLIGPHTFNFAAIAEDAVAAHAALRVADATGLAQALRRLFSEDETRQAMGNAALAFSRSAGGAVQKMADLVDRCLPG